MCNAIVRHCAAGMQFQVQDQALGLFSWMITNYIRLLLDATLKGKTKFNPPAFVTTGLCLPHQGRRLQGEMPLTEF